MSTTRDQIFAATMGHHLAPIKAYLDDPSVSEVMVNRADEIYVERHGALERTSAKFADHEAYETAINNVLQFTGKSLYQPDPLIDARLPDGSRVHVVKAPASRFGTTMTIRKFSPSMLDLDWLCEIGTLTPQAAEYLTVAVEAERNTLVAGGTSSGKTSLLNALSRYAPSGERIVVIEDAAELQLQQDHIVSLERQPPDEQGRGGADIRELFRSALRLRPDRIIVGEVRGGEALEMIQAMTAGHGGSMGTLHANSPADALNRLETMALMSEVELPLHALRAQVASAVDVVVQMSRVVGGERLVTGVCEVLPLDDEGRYQLREMFRLAPSAEGEKRLELVWTGERSSAADPVTRQSASVTELTRPIFTETTE